MAPIESAPGTPDMPRRRSPLASNHIDDGPDRIRIAWSGQTGSQLCTPSV